METLPAKTIITKTKSTEWFGADYNMNIYRGCSHGCIYCDSRSDCYRNFDFDTVKVKENALEVIRNDLRRKVKTGVIATGAMSDPYNPFENELRLTRSSLELINAYGFGVAIATKSPLVTRDLDILNDISQHSPALIKITITTVDDDLCRKLEPNVAPSSKRFGALRSAAESGIYCGVLMMPILPFINDTEENILGIVRAASENGARFIYPALGVTMRSGQREYFLSRLDGLFPGYKEKYQKAFGYKYQCSSTKAKSLWKIFAAECDNLGLLYKMRDIIRSYQMGYGDRQLTLF